MGRTIKIVFLITSTAVFIGVVWLQFLTNNPSVVQQSSLVPQQGAPSFEQAPEFSLPDLSGREVRLSDYRGSVVLLEFWATW